MPDKTHTALLLALTSNQPKKFRKILKRNGWPKDSRWSDYDLLIKALRLGRKKIAHVILDNDARVKRGLQLHSPLHIAASKTTSRWTKVIARLLSHGARVADKNFRGQTALHVAFEYRAPVEVIDLMLQAHLVMSRRGDIADRYGLRFLHIACARSGLKADKVMRFVDETNVNLQVSLECNKDYAGYTALHFAASNFKHEIAELLIKQGANIDKGDRNGTTPVHLALRHRDVRMIDLLLVNVEQRKNIVDKLGISYFMAACAGSKLSIVAEYLAESQSHIPLYDMISAQTAEIENCITGYTPLHFAVDLGQIETVEFLLDEGADCCVTTSEGLTPHMLAEKRGFEDIGEMLSKHCKIVNMCMLMRSQDADFGVWGDDYERCVLVERVREIKHVQKTLNEFRSMSDALQPSVVTVTIN